MNTQQTITFSHQFGQGNYKVLELDEEILSLFKNEGKLSIKGTGKDEMMICSKQKNFQVKLVESTNTNFLLQGSQKKDKSQGEFVPQNGEILGSFSHTYILDEVQPHLHQIKSLLLQSPYLGTTHEQKKPPQLSKLYSLNRLLKIVQASDIAISENLKEIGAFEKNGFMRLFDPKLLETILDDLLVEGILGDWNLFKLNEKECIEKLNDKYEEECIFACLKNFFHYDKNNFWSCDEKKICRSRASQILSLTKSWILSDFEEKWKETVPIDFKPDIKMLDGLAFIIFEKVGNPEISYLYEPDLDLDPKNRFKELMMKKKVWKIDEISPYLLPVIPPSQTLESFLLKNARIQTLKTGEKGYSLK